MNGFIDMYFAKWVTILFPQTFCAFRYQLYMEGCWNELW